MTIDRIPAHLVDMLRFVRELQSMVKGLSEPAFVSDRIRCLAVEKLFINLGEAAFRIGDQSANMSDIPWRNIIGLRNLLAHGYETVSHQVLFRTIVHDLPALETALTKALQDRDPGFHG